MEDKTDEVVVLYKYHGADAGLICPACGSRVNEGDRYCEECGEDISGISEPRTRMDYPEDNVHEEKDERKYEGEWEWNAGWEHDDGYDKYTEESDIFGEENSPEDEDTKRNPKRWLKYLWIIAAVVVLVLGAVAYKAGLFADKNKLLFDKANLLTSYEKDKRSKNLTEYSDVCEADIAAAIVNGTDGLSMKEFSDSFYWDSGLGRGENRDGCLLVIDASESEWYITTYGSTVNKLQEFIDSETSGDVSSYLSTAVSEKNYSSAISYYCDRTMGFLWDYSTEANYASGNIKGEIIDIHDYTMMCPEGWKVDKMSSDPYRGSTLLRNTRTSEYSDAERVDGAYSIMTIEISDGIEESLNIIEDIASININGKECSYYYVVEIWEDDNSIVDTDTRIYYPVDSSQGRYLEITINWIQSDYKPSTITNDEVLAILESIDFK